jgi:hypothetical protein
MCTLCEKIDAELGKEPDSILTTILKDISAAIKLVNGNHSKLTGGIVPNTNKEFGTDSGSENNTGMISLGTIPKRNRVLSQAAAFEAAIPDRATAPVPAPPVMVRSEIKKFQEAVTKSENSTLVFNLDMGKVPIMNTSTMSQRATLSLAAMAAEIENKTGGIPTEDTIATIDDVLSLSTNIEFFGRKTKTYVNPKDTKSGAYCTIPVRYEFPDKDTRFESEKLLRSKCGAHCATPYPIILRECIKQVSDAVRTKYPGNQVKVLVDTDKFRLRVARREIIEGEKKGRWTYFNKAVPLPQAVLDVEAKRVPENFAVGNIDLIFVEDDTDASDFGSEYADMEVSAPSAEK